MKLKCNTRNFFFFWDFEIKPQHLKSIFFRSKSTQQNKRNAWRVNDIMYLTSLTSKKLWFFILIFDLHFSGWKLLSHLCKNERMQKYKSYLIFVRTFTFRKLNFLEILLLYLQMQTLYVHHKQTGVELEILSRWGKFIKLN